MYGSTKPPQGHTKFWKKGFFFYQDNQGQEFDGRSRKRCGLRHKNPRVLWFFNFKSFIRIANLADDVTKILNSLRLKEVNSGVFLKMDRKLQVTLKKIDPYVAYG